MTNTDVRCNQCGANHADGEPCRHGGHPMFYQLLAQMRAIHDAKNADYAGHHQADPLRNFRACEEFGIPAWQGVLTRMSDKWMRICNLARNGTAAVADESMEDTLLDLANYSLLCVILRRQIQTEATNGK